MTDTTTETPITDADVEQAEREASEAAALVDALEDRVRDGDESVTPDQIEQARSLGRFARLRAEATRRKAERAKAAAHRQALAQLRAAILDNVTGGPAGAATVAAALDGVDKAIAKFLAAADKHNAWHDGIREQIRQLCEITPGEAKGEDEESGLAFADRGTYGERARVVAGDQTIEDVSPGELLAAAVYQAARRHAGPEARYSGGLPLQGGYTSLETLLRGTLTDADGWYGERRDRLAGMAAAAKVRRAQG